MTSLRRILTLATLAALVLGGCSSDDEKVKGDKDEPTTTESDGDAEATPATSIVGAPETPEGCEVEEDSELAAVQERGKPTVSVPPGAEPVDDVVGTGTEVVEGGTLTAHYVMAKGTDGTEIESSWAGEPQEIPLDQVFPGFAEAVKGMKAGGRRTFAVPVADVFGPEPPPETGLTAEDDVVFVIDLVSVSEESGGGEAKPDDKALAAAEKRGAPEVEVPKEAPKDLVVIDEVVGEGEVVCPGGTVVAHYTGVDMSSGEEFDSSWKSGEPISFGLDGVIEGWTKGLVGMKVGGRRTLVIPGAMAYGEGEDDQSGRPMGDLVFTVDLVGVG